MQELNPFTTRETANVRQSGPPGPLGPLQSRSALAIGMAMHVLTTNAVEYGALSVPEDHVEVAWHVDQEDGERFLLLEWFEQNGSAVAACADGGFGSTLIARSMSYEVWGVAMLDFAPTAVRAVLKAPVREQTVAETSE
jgi:two-component sensor histidine kinase